MKLVADAVHTAGLSVPLIGIAPLGCVNGREAFDGLRGQTALYSASGPATHLGAPLNPHHTHFLFVGNGTDAPKAWGSEISVRVTTTCGHHVRPPRVATTTCGHHV